LVVGNPARQIGWMSEYGHRLNLMKMVWRFVPNQMKNINWKIIKLEN